MEHSVGSAVIRRHAFLCSCSHVHGGRKIPPSLCTTYCTAGVDKRAYTTADSAVSYLDRARIASFAWRRTTAAESYQNITSASWAWFKLTAADSNSYVHLHSSVSNTVYCVCVTPYMFVVRCHSLLTADNNISDYPR